MTIHAHTDCSGLLTYVDDLEKLNNQTTAENIRLRASLKNLVQLCEIIDLESMVLDTCRKVLEET
tara:strand:+ start:106 stop:300 length:195 start_codon:yes stop_codon:yes gene_type:complete